MYSPRWLARLVALVVSLAVAAGCGGDAGPKKHAVQGTVTLDKKPLDKGTIYFKTIQTGAMEPLDIVNGEFKGQVGEGERRVEIVSYRTKTQDLNGMKGEVQESLIPPRYNLDSKLTAAVTAAGPNQFTFDLTSK